MLFVLDPSLLLKTPEVSKIKLKYVRNSVEDPHEFRCGSGSRQKGTVSISELMMGGVCGQGNGPFVHIIRPTGYFGSLNPNLKEFFGPHPPGGVHGGGEGGEEGFLFFNQYHHVRCL